MAQAGWIGRIVLITHKNRPRTFVGIGYQSVQAIVRSDPQSALAVLKNGSDDVMADAVGIIRVVLVPVENVPCTVFCRESVQSAIGTDPQGAVAVLKNRPHDIIAQTIGIIGIVPVPSELFFFGYISVESAIKGAYPKSARSILVDDIEVIVTQTVGIIGIVSDHGEIVTIVFVQPILSGEPHESSFILDNILHYALRQTLLDGNADELNGLLKIPRGDQILGKKQGGRNKKVQRDTAEMELFLIPHSS
jgi:hypothetical protein